MLVPDRFYGGIIGALIAAVAGALVSGYLLPYPGIPAHNPPGVTAAVWSIPGSLVACLEPACTARVAITSRVYVADGNSRGGQLTHRWVVLCCKNACHTHCDGLASCARV